MEPTTAAAATGMLMERHATGHEAARRMLIDASRGQARPLAQTAHRVVERSADPTRLGEGAAANDEAAARKQARLVRQAIAAAGIDVGRL